VEAWIVLLPAGQLGYFAAGPGTLWQTGSDPAFGAEQCFRRTLTGFLLIFRANSPAPVRTELPGSQTGGGTGIRWIAGAFSPLAPNEPTGLHPCIPAQFEVQTAVLSLKRDTALSIRRASCNRHEARTRADKNQRSEAQRPLHGQNPSVLVDAADSRKLVWLGDGRKVPRLGRYQGPTQVSRYVVLASPA
jgi:hypothetical protein